MRTLDTNLPISSPICRVASICTLTPEEFDFQQLKHMCERNTFQQSFSASFSWLAKEKNTTWTSAKPIGHIMIQMTPTKNLGREICSSHFGTTVRGKKPVAMGVNGLFVKQAAREHRNAGYPGLKFSPNPIAESECHHFLSTCHIMSVIPPASHFATRQLGAKCFLSRNLGSKWESVRLGFGWLNGAR